MTASVGSKHLEEYSTSELDDLLRVRVALSLIRGAQGAALHHRRPQCTPSCSTGRLLKHLSDPARLVLLLQGAQSFYVTACSADASQACGAIGAL